MNGRMVWIGTSWKMTKTIAEARAYVTELVRLPTHLGIQPFILPPSTALAAVRECLPADSRILLGAQAAHWGPEGSPTGEISMRMAQDAGASLVEMGHSERREQFGETDETVALKARAAVDQGLSPLICVGEPESARAAGKADEFVAAQIRAALALLSPDEIRRVVVAYEPVWAIGASGRPATREEVSPVMEVLFSVLTGLAGGVGCRALLYGGGVDGGNAADLLLGPHTDGLFVGRAGWSVAGLAELLHIGAAHVQSRRTLPTLDAVRSPATPNRRG